MRIPDRGLRQIYNKMRYTTGAIVLMDIFLCQRIGIFFRVANVFQILHMYCRYKCEEKHISK